MFLQAFCIDTAPSLKIKEEGVVFYAITTAVQKI